MRNPDYVHSGKRPDRFRRAFTLAELLAVIGIISVLLTLASVGISRIERGSALTAGNSVAEAIFSEARATAIGETTSARVVIHDDRGDTENPERLHRYLAIAVSEKGEDGLANGVWTIRSRGTLLPAGVFFDKDASNRLSQKIAVNNNGFGSWGTCLLYTSDAADE